MKNHREIHHTPTEIASELHALLAEAETLIAGSASDASAEAVDSLRSRFGAAQERLADAYDGARKKVVDGARSTDAAIRANPYQSLAIALGVGVLLGVLVGRRTK
jgi:ElaB/YqjD/DUF883 family membrane-anchored ribosome-binding protein